MALRAFAGRVVVRGIGVGSAVPEPANAARRGIADRVTAACRISAIRGWIIISAKVGFIDIMLTSFLHKVSCHKSTCHNDPCQGLGPRWDNGIVT